MKKTVLMRVLFCCYIGSAAVAGWVALSTSDLGGPEEVNWWMVHVNKGTRQGDAHLIRFGDGTYFAVDLGDNQDQFPAYLRSRGIDKLDTVIISHWHYDHYGGLRTLLKDGVSIKRVIANTPAQSVCDAEIPWGCNWNEINALKGLLREKGIPLETTQAGSVLYEKGTTRLTLIFQHDGISPPVGRTDVNDTSILLRLHHPGGDALFTGDLNKKLGLFLANAAIDLRAAILKVPHHGTEGLAPDAFFDRVQPRAALVPAPKGLWLSARSQRCREYFESRHIPTFVNGIVGTVHVRLQARGYSIRTY